MDCRKGKHPLAGDEKQRQTIAGKLEGGSCCMAAKASGLSNQVYQLKITLKGSKPPIWRRVMVPGKFSLYRLHHVIQMVMGWTDDHLHQFIIDGEYYSIPSPDDWEPVIDERRYALNRIAPNEKRKFVYQYDFGDNWEHDILVEKILPPEKDSKYPVCLKGKRACPPEDIGGMWGYEDFLEAISDPGHEQHAFYLEWIGGEFDPEEFNLDVINQTLQGLK
jgi:hypothetical protein